MTRRGERLLAEIEALKREIERRTRELDEARAEIERLRIAANEAIRDASANAARSCEAMVYEAEQQRNEARQHAEKWKRAAVALYQQMMHSEPQEDGIAYRGVDLCAASDAINALGDEWKDALRSPGPITQMGGGGATGATE